MVEKLIELDGIGIITAQKLAEAGLATTDDLLDVARTAEGRRKLAARTGLSEARLREWVKLAGRMRDEESDKERRLAAFYRAAGSWSDIDTDKLVKDIYERRRGANRRSVDL